MRPDHVSKAYAIALWDTGKIDRIPVGTTAGLQQIHAALFHDLAGYHAGQIRTHHIAKDTFRFASALYLPQALMAIDAMPETTFSQIIDKYIEMNVAHPFMEGNGRATRIWLDLILKQNLNQVVDWARVDKQDYLAAMRMSPTNGRFIHDLLLQALTDRIDDRLVFIKGIDQSYHYEE